MRGVGVKTGMDSDCRFTRKLNATLAVNFSKMPVDHLWAGNEATAHVAFNLKSDMCNNVALQ